MASPPAKRQRRSVVVSSDAEDSEADSQLSSASFNVSARSLNLRDGKGKQTNKRQREVNSKTTKSKNAKSKSASLAESAITKNASIYSFFNNATQTSQQRASKPSTPTTQTPEPGSEDTVEDISSDETTPRHPLPISSRDVGAIKSGSIKPDEGDLKITRKVSRTKRPTKSATASTLEQETPFENPLESTSWPEAFAPENLEELAVHKRKVSDVHRWLNNVMQGRERKRLLVLRGPSGSGKTTTLRLLAKELKSKLIEWQNPVGTSFENEGFVSLASQFDDFLSRTISFQGLSLTTQDNEELVTSEPASQQPKTIIAIEDFPNTFSRGSVALLNFRDSILRYLAVSTPSSSAQSKNDSITPVVMIVTETHVSSSTDHSESFTVSKLLGRQLIQHPSVTIIDFNVIAPTLLSKALATIVRKINTTLPKRWTPSNATLKQISQSGDIRSSLTSLQLAYLFDQGQATTQPKESNSKQNSTLKTKSSISEVAFRDNIIDLFHAAGKILYNKRKEDADPPTPPPPHLNHLHRPYQSEVPINELYNDIGSDVNTFISTLHENYPLSCFGQDFADTLDDCIINLSDSDLFLSSNSSLSPLSKTSTATSNVPLQSDYAFHLTAQGLLFSLPYPVERGKTMSSALALKRDPYKMLYPHALKLWRSVEDNETIIDEWIDFMQKDQPQACTRLSRAETSTEYVGYASKILPCQRKSMKKGGGKNLFGQEGQELDVDEDVNSDSAPVASVLEIPLPPAVAGKEKRWTASSTDRLAADPGINTHLILSDDDIEDD